MSCASVVAAKMPLITFAAGCYFNLRSHLVRCRGLRGIITGDAIIAVNGQPVNRANDLANALDVSKIGDTVTLLVRRGDGSQASECPTACVCFFNPQCPYRRVLKVPVYFIIQGYACICQPCNDQRVRVALCCVMVMRWKLHDNAPPLCCRRWKSYKCSWRIHPARYSWEGYFMLPSLVAMEKHRTFNGRGTSGGESRLPPLGST